MRVKNSMAECLREAKDAWKEAFLIKGYGREFDKWEVAPDPVAIAKIAAVLFVHGDSGEDANE